MADEEMSSDVAKLTAGMANLVSAMEPTSPEVMRAVKAWQALRYCGRGMQFHGDAYHESRQALKIKHFWSHSWQGNRRSKILTLLFLYNHEVAVMVATFGALLVSGLFAAKLLPGPNWEKHRDVWSTPRGYWAMLVGPVMYCAFLLLWRPQQQIFVDVMCINQKDSDQKFHGLLSMGAFLKYSDSLLVLWDPSYTHRLWCVFELAAFLHSHPAERKPQLLVRPLILGPCSVFVTLTMVVVVSALTWIPEQYDGTNPKYLVILWVSQAFMLLVTLGGIISVTRRYFRAVDNLRMELRAFSIEQTECDCCKRNHVDPQGNPIPICDRQVLLRCITTWFGSLEAFEKMVQTDVLKYLLEDLPSKFFTYRHCVAATIPFLWAGLDTSAGHVHYLDIYPTIEMELPSKKWRFSLDTALRMAGWWLGLVPVVFLFDLRLSCAFRQYCGRVGDVLVTAFILLCTVAFAMAFILLEQQKWTFELWARTELEVELVDLREALFLLISLLLAGLAFGCIGTYPRSFSSVEVQQTRDPRAEELEPAAGI